MIEIAQFELMASEALRLNNFPKWSFDAGKFFIDKYQMNKRNVNFRI